MTFRATLAVSAILTVGIVCNPHSVRADEAFAALDSNSDGVLSGKEALGLKQFDKDGDDEISESEFGKALSAWRKTLAETDDMNFKAMDQNEDGRLSGTERTNYEFCDLNNDNRITRAEYDEALSQRRNSLSVLPIDQLKQSGDEYFKILDTNEDGRLSGTEIAGLDRYDANNDGRISKEECTHGTIMDAFAGGGLTAPDTKPKPKPDPAPTKSENPIQLLADAANSQSTEALVAGMRPELLGIIDEVVLQYIVEFVHRHHGKIQAIPKSAIETRDSETPGETKLAANVRCEKGKLRLNATMYEGMMLGFQFDSAAIDQVNDELYRDLSQSLGKEDGLSFRFAKFYSPMCRQLIDLMLNGNDDDAIAMFHPQVQEQVGKEAFVQVFDLLRQSSAKTDQVDLESFIVEQDKDGDYSFKMSHRVTGDNDDNAQLVTTGFQIVGMKTALVSVSVAPVAEGESDAKPTTLAQLVNEAWEKLDREASPDAPADGLAAVDASRDGLTFRMPGEPERRVDDNGYVFYELEHEGSVYSAIVMTFDFNLEEQSKVFFEGINTEIPKEVNGDLVNAEEKNWESHPGQMSKIELKDGRQMNRFDVVIGATCYTLQCTSTDTSDEFVANSVVPFLDSLKAVEKTPSDDLPAPPTAAPEESPVPAPPKLD